MPRYEFRCEDCGGLSEIACPIADRPARIACSHCGGLAHRIVSGMAVRLSSASKVERLDPKYDRMVDQAMRNTRHADPDRLLKRMKPFSGEGGSG
jgi:putative FmdB family regulatory protein